MFIQVPERWLSAAVPVGRHPARRSFSPLALPDSRGDPVIGHGAL